MFGNIIIVVMALCHQNVFNFGENYCLRVIIAFNYDSYFQLPQTRALVMVYLSFLTHTNRLLKQITIFFLLLQWFSTVTAIYACRLCYLCTLNVDAVEFDSDSRDPFSEHHFDDQSLFSPMQLISNRHMEHFVHEQYIRSRQYNSPHVLCTFIHPVFFSG